MIPLANHLWQSTLFAFIAGVLSLALRKNHARTRHAIWMIASVKFLLPFSVLVGMGSLIEWRTAPKEPAIPIVLEQIGQPFLHTQPAAVPTVTPDIWPALALTVWLCGCGAVFCSWALRWRRCRSALSRASVAQIDAPIEVRSSPALLEPGVFGIFRPILLLPQGIADRMTKAQLDAILAHELCHVRRRDNLAAAIHMLVEATFWFHPLVWWIGARLVDERERACDEEVLRLGNDPQVYAEGILKVCQFYLESPIACVSGITGADLKKRIEDIMTRRVAEKLDIARKLLLAAMGIAAVAGPFAIGLVNAPPTHAQSPAAGPAARLEFETASIKPNKSGGVGFSVQHSPAGITATNASLKNLIKMAYRAKNFQLSGEPGWLDSDRFDIVAKAPPNTPRDQFNAMLQTLLAERFHFALHRDTKVVQGYALIVAKTGARLVESKSEGSNFRGDRAGISGEHMSMAQFAENLAYRLDSPIVDFTGIQGFFDVKLTWTPDESQPMTKPGEGGERLSTAAPADGVTLFTALQDQLGLKLEARKVPAEILVIDHVERTPTEN